MAKAKSPAKKKVVAKKPATKRAPRAKAEPATKALVKGDYILTLEVNEKVYESDGTSSIEAFQNLAAQFPGFLQLKTRATITLSNGNLQSSQIIFVLQLRRLLKSFTVMQVWAKRMEAALKDNKPNI